MLESILKFKLNILAHMYLRRFNPMIIAVTGNVGKTSTKEAIGVVVAKIKKTRISGGNLNNELGIPMTILGDWEKEYYDKGPSLFFWIKVLMAGFFKYFFPQSYPEVLLLEYGADKPGDIARLARKYRPHISVVTSVGDIPVHVENFANPEAVAHEKSNLVKILDVRDYAVLSYDDMSVREMKNVTKAHVQTFGFEQGATVVVSDFKLISAQRPIGVEFNLVHEGENDPVSIKGSLGKAIGQSAAAAACVGVILGLDMRDIAAALNGCTGPKGRLKIIEGIKKSWIIDDTYNAAPASTRLALETLRDIPAKRKIAVLGDMLELGSYSVDAHKTIGDLVGNAADILVAVGMKSKFIADAAGNQMMKENIFSFQTSEEAKLKVQDLMQEGDLVLVKGSQGMRMEKIVEEIMAEPDKAKDLLVRQSQSWKKK